MTMRARDNMITQGIKRWLRNLFAWWPWKAVPEDDYAQTPEALNKGISQETLFFTAVDGPYAQPGITSVAVESVEEDVVSESGRPTAEERSTPLSVSSAEDSIPAPIIEEKPQVLPVLDATQQGVPEPTHQQRLEFLRYLVERGIVNEG